ncbi:MAG TPA: ABC transporter substrate-binding protein [Candidatus Limnocylindria bacterium]|jgi:NitT/TauT family transport system substrate-binding protein|nr:ABC transporter substrate-binding protein [Candidatus Limnocylindria bacterium]
MRISRAQALAGAAASFALPLLPGRAWAAGPTTVRLAAAPDDDITPILYGQSSGIFKKAGLDVQLSVMGSGSATASAVAGGAIDIGKSSLTSLISAHARGIPFVIVAPASLYLESAPIAGLVVAKDSALASGRDFNGKTVSASSLKDLMAVATQAWIDQHGGDSSSVRFIEIPSSAVAVALGQKKIDGATMVTPALAEALDSGNAKLLGRSFSAIAKRFLVAGWFTTRDYVAHEEDTVRRFVAAFREASAYTDTHHAQTVALLAEYSRLAPQTVRRMVRSTVGTSVEPRDIQPVIDAAVRYKVIDRPFPAQELIANLAPAKS